MATTHELMELLRELLAQSATREQVAVLDGRVSSLDDRVREVEKIVTNGMRDNLRKIREDVEQLRRRQSDLETGSLFRVQKREEGGYLFGGTVTRLRGVLLIAGAIALAVLGSHIEGSEEILKSILRYLLGGA
jgi:hypothetical protein